MGMPRGRKRSFPGLNLLVTYDVRRHSRDTVAATTAPHKGAPCEYNQEMELFLRGVEWSGVEWSCASPTHPVRQNAGRPCMKVRYNLALLRSPVRPLSSRVEVRPPHRSDRPQPGEDRDGLNGETEKFVIERWGQYFAGIVAVTPYLHQRLCIVKTSRGLK